MSGDTVVIGAYRDDIGANADQGSAYVFLRSGTTWSQQAQLTASDGAASDFFGTAVAVDSNTVVVGASFDNVGSNADQGSACVFTRSGTTVSASSLELLKRERGPDGRDTFVPQLRLPDREIRWVELEHRDSVLNGALIGLAAGAGLGALMVASAGCDECTSDQQAAVFVSIPLFLGGISAGIGALVDATIHRVVTVYQAPGQRSADVRLVPLLSRSRASLQVAIRFSR